MCANQASLSQKGEEKSLSKYFQKRYVLTKPGINAVYFWFVEQLCPTAVAEGRVSLCHLLCLCMQMDAFTSQKELSGLICKGQAR